MSATQQTAPAFGSAFDGSAAENYERYFVRSIARPVADGLVAAADIRSGHRVLDVACGTGVVARLVAERVGSKGSVAGLDVNPGMIAKARSLAESAGQSIRWYESGVESMPLPDESFDRVICQLGLQFVSDKPAALREMRRVLTQEGRVTIGVPRSNAFFRVLDEALARHIDPAIASFLQTVFALEDPRVLEELLREAHLRDSRARVETIRLALPSARDFMWQYIQSTPLAELVARTSAEQKAALERDVVAGWKPWTTSEGMQHDAELVFATASR
jgi:ubiquinone/menaquinone biosynthesis C-methylase UbiE